jgi:glycosyltransferase involved in cell wall biosynthesis
LVAVIPAYNEERFIGSVVLRTREFVDSVVVVDDGSRDATGQIAKAAGATVVRHRDNLGKGAALNTGFQTARAMEPEGIVLLDGDGQHRTEEISQVLSPILNGEADVVVGSRYLRGRGAVPFHRTLGHRVFTLLTNLASGIRVTDSQSGFRAYSSEAVSVLTISSTGFAVESEQQFKASDLGLRLVEVPISACYQDEPKRPVVAHGLGVLRGLARLVGRYRPLLSFGGVGTLVLLAGVALGMRSVRSYDWQRILTLAYALIVVLLLDLGSQALFTGVVLHAIRSLLAEFLRRDER